MYPKACTSPAYSCPAFFAAAAAAAPKQVLISIRQPLCNDNNVEFVDNCVAPCWGRWCLLSIN